MRLMDSVRLFHCLLLSLISSAVSPIMVHQPTGKVISRSHASAVNVPKVARPQSGSQEDDKVGGGIGGDARQLVNHQGSWEVTA